MKKWIVMTLLGFLFLPAIASAADIIDLDNYYYAHANKPGTYVLHDKYNHTQLYGDYEQNDADLLQINFRNWHGMSGEKLKATMSDGSTLIIMTDAATLTFPVNNKYVKLEMIKTTYVESFVEISTFNVHDQSNGGVNLTYRFLGDTPTDYGDLGTGTPTATATPTPAPTASPVPTPTPTPKPTPINAVNLFAYRSGQKIVWSAPPSNTDHIEFWKNGVKVATLDKAIREYGLITGAEAGEYEIKAVSTQGNVIGYTELFLAELIDASPTPVPTSGTDPDPDPDPDPAEPECTAACQTIIDQLDCPKFDEYLGKWAEMIKGTYPPPPNWNNVAAIMRDTIVPAMGQEIVNRSPEIAKIIADELQSREKAVSPPAAVPDFTPPVPRLQDTPKVTGSINEAVPSFTPDYSEDKGFVIPDPSTLDFSDNSDDGYEYQPMHTENPNYVNNPVDPSTVDPGYAVKDQEEFEPPTYVGGRWNDAPPPTYTTGEGDSEVLPDYEQPTPTGEDRGDYRDYKTITDEYQEYKGGE